ncbi:BA75_00798T0 [Komagataella pastoris]|uniref:Altered inheritance of mitochondria protein 41 n=1 Tax=Komagataella pastoris TaxID=4922 RepID=A0A1B2J607_PICPA|nr:BA75_00798T0 [Komagataella pastoris]
MFTLAARRLAIRLPRVRFGSSSAYDEALASIRNDLKLNFRFKADVLEKNVIRSILAETKNLEIDNKDKDLDEFKLYDLLSKMIKQRQDSAAIYLKEGSPDRFRQTGWNELREVDYITKYLEALPVASAEEIEAKVEPIVQSVLEEEGELKSPKEIFSRIPWKVVNQEWQASEGAVKNCVLRLYNLYKTDA